MSSPRERSEARRKALLSRGGDRLKKLTSSARGEDAPQFSHDDPPLAVPSIPLRSFLGESTPDSAPTPPTAHDWSPEQLKRAMDAIAAPSNIPSPESDTQSPALEPPPLFKTLTGTRPIVCRARSERWARSSSLVTLLTPLIATFYFVVFHEPSIYQSYAPIGDDHWAARWSQLGVRGTNRVLNGVQAVPLFSTLLSFQFAQQVLNALYVPAAEDLYLFTIIVPHLPPNFRRWISQLLFCLRLFSALLDQIAVAVFGVGLITCITTGIYS